MSVGRLLVPVVALAVAVVILAFLIPRKPAVQPVTEHHPSRAVGGTRINLMRLNMSLDSIK